MTEYKRVFLDTAPLIYFLDNDERYGSTVKAIFEEILAGGGIIESSVITCEEYLVYPYRTGNVEKIQEFVDFTGDFDIHLNPITREIAQKAAKIRAEYTGFKAMDALQLATAIMTGCDAFLTNDRQLLQFTEIKCITPEQWVQRK